MNDNNTNYNDNTDHDNSTEEAIISKSRVKKEMLQFQSMGETLLALSPNQLSQIPLGASTQEALAQAKKMKAGNTRRRQIQRIGKLLRSDDTAAIKDKLEQFTRQDKAHISHQQQATRWQEQLINNSQASLSDFISQYPRCDRQQLRQLIRHAQKETNTPSKYAVQLFKQVYQIISG